MIKVAIGDVGEYLSKHLNDSVLYTSPSQIDTNIDQNFHTSIADCDLNNFIYLLEKSDELFYCPPDTWSDGGKKYSQLYWYNLLLPSFIHQKTTHNFPTPYQFVCNNKYHSYPIEQRKTNGEQIWVVGCSIANSDGVDIKNSFGHLLSKKLKRPASWLTKNSSSIKWQSNQICQSDIRQNDLIFWAVTYPARTDFFFDDNLYHITPPHYDRNLEHTKYLDLDHLDNQNAKYNNVNAILRAVKFVHKQKAKIFLIDVTGEKANSLFEHLQGLENIISIQYQGIDIGSDGKHPGPRSHKFMYNEFLNMLEKSKQS